ncbi:acyl-CoA dehydrogenase family protein [Frondihabitans cladoniiphilus]|uniref:Acyl-CoA dehydrogenase family protein n=1 Tax=Frondihabitans cladoniiphilus TaxID=715785 RepID=A0ABP8W4Z9_9MICO
MSTPSTDTRGRTLADIVHAVNEVAATARAEAVARERDRTSPAPLVAALAAARLGAVRVPQEFGGPGGTVADLADLLIEVAAADSNLAQIVRGHLGFVEFLIAQPAGEARTDLLQAAARGDLFGPAASISARNADGSAATALLDSSTWLHEVDGTTRLSGRKYYTTGSLHSQWINALVAVDDVLAEVVVRVDDPGVEIDDDWNGFGQPLTASGTTRFDAALVREGHVFPHDDQGLSEYLNAFYQFVHSATQAGIVRRAGEDLVEVVRSRKRTYPLATAPEPRHDPQVLEVVGEVTSHAYATRASVESLARTFDRYLDVPSRGSRTRVVEESAAVQVHNTRSAGEATWRLFDAASASAVDAELALDRHFRNARTVSSHNPVVYKARLVGDIEVNGHVPSTSIAAG